MDILEAGADALDIHTHQGQRSRSPCGADIQAHGMSIDEGHDAGTEHGNQTKRFVLAAGGGNGQAQVDYHGGNDQAGSITMAEGPIGLRDKTDQAREEEWLGEGEARQTESRENGGSNGPPMMEDQEHRQGGRRLGLDCIMRNEM